MSWFIFRGLAIESKDPEPETSKEEEEGEDVVVVSGTAGTVRAAALGAVHRIVRAHRARGVGREEVLLLLADPPRLKVKGAPRDTPPRASPRGGATRGRSRGEHARRKPARRARVTLATPSTRSAPRPPVPRARGPRAIPESQDLDPDARLAERATPVRANAPRAHVVLPLTNPPRPGVDLCRRRARRSGRAPRRRRG